MTCEARGKRQPLIEVARELLSDGTRDLRLRRGAEAGSRLRLRPVMVSEDLNGRSVAVALAWPVVQLQSDFSATGLSEVLHGGALGAVLPNEPVGVLVGATLPRVIRSGKVEGRVGGSLDVTIAVELGPVVDSDGLEQVPLRADQLNNAAVRSRDRS